jgi:hypothetical protein
VVVLGRRLDERELLDAESVAGHLVDRGSVFWLLAGHRRVLFPESLFVDLFPSGRGRPSVPADVAASVLVLQALHGLSDREAMAAVRTDLRWKVACGLPIGHGGFDASTLTYWRRRLAASSAPNRIFDAVRSVVAETGVLTGRNRRALDSTILDDAVATQDTVTQLVAVIRKVRREVPGAAAVVAEVCSAHDYDDPGKPRIAWDDQEARAVLVDALVKDALAVLAVVGGWDLDGPAAEAVALLALIAGQDVEPADGSDGTDGRWRIARQVAADRVISVVDPEARHAHKTVHRRQDGFKAHVAVEPETGITTACDFTKASGAGAMDGGDRDPAAERRHHDHRARRPRGRGRVGGQRLRHRRRARGDHRRRASPVGQARTIAAGRAGRVHRRRLHRGRAGVHGDLPERSDPSDHPDPQGHVRGWLSRLPVAGPVHHPREGADFEAARA